MSAFGVILVGLGILMMWATVKGEKINDVLHGFYQTPAKTAAATTAPARSTLT